MRRGGGRVGCGPKMSSGDTLPNPNPSNYVIEDTLESGSYVIVKIKYTDCTNYEGLKILVYEGISEANIRKLGRLDPHFCEDKISPIARFEPTPQGWMNAAGYIDMLNNRKDKDDQ